MKLDLFSIGIISRRRIGIKWGKHYDWLFDNRQKADYRPLVVFDIEQVKDILEKSEGFVRVMRIMSQGEQDAPSFLA